MVQQGLQAAARARPSSPIYDELRALVRKTVGLVEPLERALAAAREDLELALVYGSVAKGQDTASSDIDLLLVSDSLTLESVYRLIAEAEKTLGRKISPTLYSSEEFRRRRRKGNPLLKRVLASEPILLIGTLSNGDGVV